MKGDVCLVLPLMRTKELSLSSVLYLQAAAVSKY